MQLRSLALAHFRNVEHAELALCPRFNLVVGANGQGKTNLLEAVYFLATLRSFRTNRLDELIQHGAAEARVDAELASGTLERQVRVTQRRGARVIDLDGVVVRPPAYFGTLAAVCFTPDDLWLLKGDPDARRRWMDRAVFTRRPAYLRLARDYQHALKNRNALLRHDRPDALMLDALSEQLAALGAEVVAARVALLDDVRPAFAALVGSMLEGADVGLEYRALGLESTAPTRDALHAALTERLPLDRRRRYTSVGPHADDLALSLRGRGARRYASQGQQRTLALALRMAEVQRLEATLGEHPLLLLDDVSSELDAERNALLFRYLNAFGGQVVITTTDAAYVRLDEGLDRRTFEVSAGTAELRRTT